MTEARQSQERGSRARDLRQVPEEWARFQVLCRANGSTTGEEVRKLLAYQLGDAGAPHRFPAGAEVDVEAKSGRTSARVPDDLWWDYVAAVKAAETTVSEQVRLFVRWQLRVRGAKRPEPLMAVDAAVVARAGVRYESGALRLAPCGTKMAYRRHLRNGEPVDDACREANARAAREYSASRRARSS